MFSPSLIRRHPPRRLARLRLPLWEQESRLWEPRRLLLKLQAEGCKRLFELDARREMGDGTVFWFVAMALYGIVG